MTLDEAGRWVRLRRTEAAIRLVLTGALLARVRRLARVLARSLVGVLPVGRTHRWLAHDTALPARRPPLHRADLER